VSEATAETLINCGCYPLRPWLKDLLHETSFVEYDANTIATLAETLIARSDSLEKAIRVTDLLAEEICVAPNIFSDYTPQQLRAASEKSALMIAIVRTLTNDAFSLCHGIVVRASQNVSEVRISALLGILEHTREDLGDLGGLPKAFEGRFLICEGIRDFLLALDERVLWQRSIGNDDVEMAIKVALFKERVRRNEPAAWHDLPRFHLNERFFDSVRERGALQNFPLAQSSIRAIVEAIEGRQMADTHMLRIGAGPNDPQVMRGSDAAWRRDIDRVYHLHYWACGGGLLELACLVPHNTFEIYY
jgi:hypothetical protein